MPSIAIAGMACRYPDARNPAELWENVLAQRRAFRRMPDERLRLADYFSEDRNAPDKTYSPMAAVIEGYEFDRVRFRVSGSAFRSADLTHWLALDIASEALEDAGFGGRGDLPRESTGVYVGNTLAGEFARANVMRLRWPYVRRSVEAALEGSGLPAGERAEFLERLESQYKSPFPGVGEDTLAGGMSNTIAGRIANHFDLKGGAYAVDGACASSLLSVATACKALEAGEVDVAIAGGVDLSLDPFELVGFAKAGALAHGAMRVFDERSNGFWPGEGCGMVVLMRATDAAAKGRRGYATIRGWGISSDGSGGITRPEVEGQLLALRRAYKLAGFGPGAVACFEGHGTGTQVGDTTELKVLSRARDADGWERAAAVGSIKANIGHAKAAAGVAGLIKASLAVHHQILPPATGCERPHAQLTREDAPLRILRTAEPWPHDEPVRAAVSAMGFGGINAHLALAGAAWEPRPLGKRERLLAASAQDAELFVFAAADRDGLRGAIARVAALAPRLSFAEMSDLAGELARTLEDGACRAAIIASTPAELAAGLDGLSGRFETDAAKHIFFGEGETGRRVGFLFPGQGAPAHLTGGAWRRRFPCVDEAYAAAGLPMDADARDTSVAQPAIASASVAALGVLRRLGITAEVAIGHSLGELTALHWSGAFDEHALLRIARARGEAMAGLDGPAGAMASIAAPAARVESLLDRGAGIAGFNSPMQTVISGESRAVSGVVEKARAAGLTATLLPVANAFHSPLVAGAAPVLADVLREETLHAPARTVFSTVTGARLDRNADLRELLERQITQPVRFNEALAAAAGSVDLWIEAGPGEILSGLAAACTGQPAFPLDAGGASLVGLMQACAALFTGGVSIRLAEVLEQRFTRPFSLEWTPKFFASPCESAPVSSAVQSPVPREAAPDLGALPAPAPVEGALETVRALVAARAELPARQIRDDSRLLSDLHLNSIVVSQLVSEAARRMGVAPPLAPTEYADSSIAEIAQALEESAQAGPVDDGALLGRVPPGVDSWFRAFEMTLVERPLQARRTDAAPGVWTVVAPGGHPLAQELRALFDGAPGNGVALCLPPAAELIEEHSREAPGWMLEAAHRALAERRGMRFVVVQHGGGGAPLARTLHLESPATVCCVVDLPFDLPGAAARIRDEALAAAGYAEAHYDQAGRRREPRMRLFEGASGMDEGARLGPDDVLLVTGGGKGIAAECGLALARSTGCRLALLGRSDPALDEALAANLARLEAAGVRFRYARAGVAAASEVRRAVAECGAALGHVTAILHGAGTNVPRLLASLDVEAFDETLAPKVAGLRNVLHAIDPGRVRLLIAFGSLTARVGMRGEADYATANHWLTLLTERWQMQHPHCRCLSLEWSVWSGVGMGQRLGRLDALLRQGITPIPNDEAIRLLEESLRLGPGAPVALILTGRFGDPPTLQMDRPELPFLRFLERTRAYVPGVELIVEAEISGETDPYVADHQWRGQRLWPAVFGLEAMAQTAMALLGSSAAPAFERVRFDQPVIAPASGAVTIRIAALVREAGCCEVVLRSSETAFQVDHFSAVCRISSRALGRVVAGASEDAEVALDPARDLYGSLLFHSGRFQRLGAYRRLTATECMADILPSAASDEWFWPYLPCTLVLGDPGARDAAIHAIQACIPHATLLPSGVERVCTSALPFDGPLRVHAAERRREGAMFVYDVEIADANGAIVERWEGLALHRVDDLPARASWPPALVAPWLERRFEELAPDSAASLSFGVSTNAAAGLWRPDGKPESNRQGKAVSRSYAAGFVLELTGDGVLACDMESVEGRPWEDVLGEYSPLAQTLAARGGSLDAAGARVWCALECLKKAGAAAGAPLVLESIAKDGVVTLRSGRLAIFSFIARVPEGASIAFSLLAAQARAGAVSHALL